MAITIQRGEPDSHLPIALTPHWGEYPNVEVSLRLGWENNTLLLLFKVRSPQLIRMVQAHNGPVYEDSCTEIFIKRADCAEYLNFEFSASTFILAAKGSNRDDRTFFEPSVIDQITRRVEILENTNHQSRYAMSIALDLELFGLVDKEETPNLFVNFTACGDGHNERYYLAANPIQTVKPDFHTPQYFTPLIFSGR